MRSSLQRFTVADLKPRLQEARICAAEEVWGAAIKCTKKFESYYWSTDNIHESVEPVVVSLDTDDENDLFLESDEELSMPFD